MKYLIPLVTALMACFSQALAQSPADVVTYTADGEQVVRIVPDRAEVNSWYETYKDDLFAWPVDVDIALTPGEPVQFDFQEAKRVILVLEAGMGSSVQIRSKRDDYDKTHIFENNSGKHLIEVPASSFELQVIRSTRPEIRITHAYVESVPAGGLREFGFGSSAECHINAVCDENTAWRDVMRSTVRIMMITEEGAGWCSGTLVNNTARDGRPLILSAEHCLGNKTPIWDLWTFDFNYRSESCENPADEPEFNRLIGCSFLAKERDTDFMLLELNNPVPVFFRPYFSGWVRKVNYLPDTVALLHHPVGDIQKVSIDRDKIQIWDKKIDWVEGYSTPPNTHYRSRFDFGTYEGGSSGSGLFDTDGLLVGQLHGGTQGCILNTSYTGILAVSWDYNAVPSARLRDWLDPEGMDSTVLHGMEHPALATAYSAAGSVKSPSGQDVTGITINVEGDLEMAITADSSGAFALETLARSDSIVWIPRRINNNQLNGVSATDLLLIRKHLLGEAPFTEDWQLLAADATGNGELSASDIVLLQKMLIGLQPQLPSQFSWVFSPATLTTQNPETDTVQLNFTAIKVGDVNGNADPSK